MKDPIPRKIPLKFDPFIYPVRQRIKLSLNHDLFEKQFLDVIFSRRSERVSSTINSNQLSQLLHICTRIHSIQMDESGYVLTQRSTPSGGARHPVDILVSISSPIAKRSLEYYNPIDHSLGELSLDKVDMGFFFNEISDNLPIDNACIIWFSIQPEKMNSKYQNPESLYWKETGALLYCIQVVSTYLGFKSCPVGTLASNSFDTLFKTKLLISGGGILVGI